jgi:hypothetical protein
MQNNQNFLPNSFHLPPVGKVSQPSQKRTLCGTAYNVAFTLIQKSQRTYSNYKAMHCKQITASGRDKKNCSELVISRRQYKEEHVSSKK